MFEARQNAFLLLADDFPSLPPRPSFHSSILHPKPCASRSYATGSYRQPRSCCVGEPSPSVELALARRLGLFSLELNLALFSQQHEHNIVGGSKFGKDYSQTDSISGKCTTAEVTLDKVSERVQLRASSFDLSSVIKFSPSLSFEACSDIVAIFHSTYRVITGLLRRVDFRRDRAVKEGKQDDRIRKHRANLFVFPLSSALLLRADQNDLPGYPFIH